MAKRSNHRAGQRPYEPGPVMPIEEFRQSPEFALIASMMKANYIIDDVLQIIQSPEHLRPCLQARELFAAIIRLHENGKTIDAATLAEEAKRRNIIDDLGGYVIFSDLWESQPTGANAVWWAQRCRDRAIRWQLAHIAIRLGEDAAQLEQPAEDLLSRYEAEFMSIGAGALSTEAATLQTILADCTHRIDMRCKNDRDGCSGVPTGYFDLDELVNGFNPGDLVLIASRPGIGKTMLACNILRNISKYQPSIFISLEQSRSEIVERILCAEARIDSHHVRTGRLDSSELDILVEAQGRLNNHRLFIDDTPLQNVSRIGATIRRMKRRHNLQIALIDYIQLIEPDVRSIPRHEQVASISRRLKLLARDLNIPIAALCQVNRSSEERADHRPRLADLRESGALEADADVVLLLHQPASAPGTIIVDVAKHRHGPTGEVVLTYIKKFGRFDNYAGLGPKEPAQD